MARGKGDLRNYSLILYPESDGELIENIVENYDYYLMLHNYDVDEFGELIKPHYHCIIRFENTKSPSVLASELGVKIERIEFVRNLTGMVRYLVHADNPKKYQYDRRNIQTNCKIEHFFVNRSDESIQAGLIIEYIETNKVCSNIQLAKWAHSKGLWSTYRRGASIWSNFIREMQENRLREVKEEEKKKLSKKWENPLGE